MPRSTYTAAFKTKIVLEVLREERELGEIAAEHNLSPNMIRNWKREFLDNAETVFENPKKLERQAKRKEAPQPGPQPEGHRRKLWCLQENREQGPQGRQREEHFLAAE